MWDLFKVHSIDPDTRDTCGNVREIRAALCARYVQHCARRKLCFDAGSICVWLPANQFEICVICLRYVGYGQERHKLCFDIFVFVCQPRSLKTLQLQQTFRSEFLVKSICNRLGLDLRSQTACVSLKLLI